MHSPTALTPEPVDGSISMTSMHSLESISDLDQGSISLTPSPLAVRTLEDAPVKSNHSVHHVNMPDGPTTNLTPNKPTHTMSQTPLRSTPLLTPPSSNERPNSQFPVTLPQRMPSSQIPLTEKIQARSALYSQAIQNQQQQKVLINSNQHKPAVGTPILSQVHYIETLSNTLPSLSYQQLQQQHQLQQTQHQHNAPSLESSFDISEAPKELIEKVPAGNLELQAPSLTAVELPVGVECASLEGLDSAACTSTAQSACPIPKPDPLENPLKTTNVYINGLPLRWTDDDLYRLTRGFGAVKSVKMFTRHLEDKPSAYGFVLFNCVEDAERFITTLRQHTQFHPSFAKTIKVPGTTNSKHAIADPIIPVSRDEEYADISILGLPISVDMQTLRALFAPQVIKASKFFHTTGTPRRLIGFIRLESKQAVDEIMERLHGSSVLGWSENLVIQAIPSTHDGGIASALGQSSLEQKIASMQPQHPGSSSSASRPLSLGVYQHQQVQANDIVRLVETMKMSEPHHTASGSPAVPSSSIESHLRGTAPQLLPPVQLYDSAQSSGQRSISSINIANVENDRLGLGINIGKTFARPVGLGQSLPVIHTPSPASEPLQQTQFQSAVGAPPATLYALQAAVLAQDLLFSSAPPSSLRRATSYFSLEPNSHQDTLWTPTIQPPLQGLKDKSLHRSLAFNLSADVGRPIPTLNDHLMNAPSARYSRRPSGISPGLPPFSFVQGDAAFARGAESVKNVPSQLPGLTPSSQPSSPEPSPITPTFGNLVQHLAGTKSEDA
ncbi:SubName: Full=Uncharacterized protein {ECO:0000313/EMBL:CCA70109.1} [Serendipita indica DSM 11827]|nr:SubName: Full=Uncharacterized protein {ECO:0000313/EMBL:CCA70109.1} [Serendipita indica DSM 11827]